MPIKFQLSYPIALRLEVELRNKGISLRVEDGDEITAPQKDMLPVPKPASTFLEKISPSISVENVLKKMENESSVKTELFGKLFSQRKDLLIIVLIALIPFFSIKMDDGLQIMFYPTFLGILWAFIVFSFLETFSISLINGLAKSLLG